MASTSDTHQIHYGESVIRFQLSYAERKTLAISVHPDLRVTVNAPERSDFALIEQKVKKRAAYRQPLIDDLSRRLTERYGRGFSSTTLRYFRNFYLAYTERSPEIRHPSGGKLPQRIFARRYRLALPDEAQLREEIRRELRELGEGGEE